MTERHTLDTTDLEPITAADPLLVDLAELYAAFHDNADLSGGDEARAFAEGPLDFRAGRPREDTPWGEGVAISLAQREATIDLARKWHMLETTYPTGEFDYLVVLGAHKDSLKLRTQHALDIWESVNQPLSELLVLSCFRPIHPKEGVKDVAIETEADLAISLLEKGLVKRFELESASAWNDLELDPDQLPGEHAVTLIGRLGLINTAIISGSVPSNSSRATTISTLESLRSYIGDSTARLLFVTTALHLPYQAIQVRSVLRANPHEIVGIGYPSFVGLSVDSPSAQFRVILQEIGATIKNYLQLQKS